MDDSADPNPLSPNLAEISDGDLLAGTRRLVGASNQVLAALLTHLGEIEARGIYRTRACSSLYIYCVYELRFSEDAAFRRVSAARLVRKFPALLDAIASGELHLTALLMVGPHLTVENFCDVLARAKHRTKREIARLVRELDPLPDVPARIEPLGPVAKRVGRVSHEKTMLALYPVRHLSPGERPRDWMDPELVAELAGGGVGPTEQSDEPAPARNEAAPGHGSSTLEKQKYGAARNRRKRHPPRFRASADQPLGTDVFRRPFGAKFSSATRGAARTSTQADSAAGKPIAWRCTTCTPLGLGANTRPST